MAYTPVWLILQCGLYSSAAYTPVWLILQCGLYSSVAYTPVWLILQCGLYSSVAYTPGRLILQGGLYSSVAYTPVWLILQCGLYSSAAYTPVRLILQCGLYSSAAYTPKNTDSSLDSKQNECSTKLKHGSVMLLRPYTHMPTYVLNSTDSKLHTSVHCTYTRLRMDSHPDSHSARHTHTCVTHYHIGILRT